MAHHAHRPGDCPFCRIAAGDLPAHVVTETENCIAFLDIMPIREGHVQIIPRQHHETFEILPAELAAEILGIGQRIAGVLKRMHPVKRVAFVFSGSDVPHAHAHLVPMVEASDITSRRYIAEETVTFRNLPRPEPAELAGTAARLRALLEPSSAGRGISA